MTMVKTVTYLIALVSVAAVLGLISLAAPSPAAAMLPGLISSNLADEEATAQDRIAHEISARLGARATRVLVKWPLAEPQQGQYDEDRGAPGIVREHVLTATCQPRLFASNAFRTRSMRPNTHQCLLYKWPPRKNSRRTERFQ